MNHSDGASDPELIAAALAGQQQAFGQLVIRYQDRLFNGVVRMLRCEELAADVVQDTFVLAWRKLDRFAGRSGFYTWLFRIARNQALSRLRARKPMASLDDQEWSAADRVISGEPAPDAELQKEDDRMQLEQALARLSEEHRSILVLREMEELDYEQIAEALGVPVGTVRSRLFRARLQLRDELTRTMAGETASRGPASTGAVDRAPDRAVWNNRIPDGQ